MTKQNTLKQSNLIIGSIIKKHRIALNISKSRQGFIDDRIDVGMLPENWISDKTLTNIENGHNVPSLSTLKMLSYALEIDLIDLIIEIKDYI